MLQDRQMNLLEDILYDTTEDNVTTFENIEVLYNNTNIYYSKMPVVSNVIALWERRVFGKFNAKSIQTILTH